MGGRASLPIVAIGCVLVVVGLVTVSTRAVPVRTGTNGMLTTSALGGSAGRVMICQDLELIPSGTGAIRVSLATMGQPGPSLAAVAANGRTTIARGTLAAGWSGETAVIPVRPVTREQRPAHVCVTVGPTASVLLRGDPATDPSAGPHATASGTALRGRLRFEYLAPERHTWWSQIGAIARRMSFGHAIGGGAVALLTVALMLVAASLSLRLLVRDVR